jgi:hypothetical protein
MGQRFAAQSGLPVRVMSLIAFHICADFEARQLGVLVIIRLERR